jgi:alpha-mannosidase II
VHDYTLRLSRSLSSLYSLSSQFATSILSKHSSNPLQLSFSEEKNSPTEYGKKVMEVSEGRVTTVVVFNSLSFHRHEVVEVLVSGSFHQLTVFDSNGNEISSQLNPIWTSPSSPSSSTFALHFLANIPALMMKTFFITVQSPSSSSMNIPTVEVYSEQKMNEVEEREWKIRYRRVESNAIQSLQLENGNLSVSLNNGFITSVKYGKKTMKVEQEFMTYGGQRSGAYIFYPSSSAASIEKRSITLHVIRGSLLQELHVTFTSPTHSLISQRIRIYKNSDLEPIIEIQHTVDMSSSSFTNHELITRYSTDIHNRGFFYTDSNSFDTQQRFSSSSSSSSSWISSNYYPMTSHFILRDEEMRFSVLSKQSLGAASLQEGTCEVMLDRRLSRDDGRGLGEGVLDNVRTLIPLWLLFQPSDSSSSFESKLLHRMSSVMNHPLQLFFGSSSSMDEWRSSFQMEFKPLSSSLPTNVHLLSMKTMKDELISMQLWNSETQVTAVDLRSFPHFELHQVDDKTLTLLHPENHQKLHFNGDKSRKLYRQNPPPVFSPSNPISPPPPSLPQILLEPKELRTLLLSKLHKNSTVQIPLQTQLFSSQQQTQQTATQQKKPQKEQQSPTLPEAFHMYSLFLITLVLFLFGFLFLKLRKKTRKRWLDNIFFGSKNIYKVKERD